MSGTISKKFDHAKLLYNILPAVYRERDQNRDLQKYLNGTGLLLDQIQSTLLQRYADIFPDSDTAFGINSQTWLLPYMAALLDVRLVSPTVEGQREEIANAIAWRKAKGTLEVVDQVAEAIGGMEVVVHEGWKRAATTARVGMPMLPIDAYGYNPDNTYSNAFESYQQTRQPDLAPWWARHPALPAGTVDLRCQGAAVAASEDNPAAITSQIGDSTYRWRQSSLHGSQSCNPGHSVLPLDNRISDWIPGYFDDPSVRTVDFRNPNWRQGHFHPKQVLLFAATQAGFFQPLPASRRFQWSEALFENEAFLDIASIEINENITVFRNKSLDQGPFKPIVIRLRVKLEQVPSGTGPVNPKVWRFEGFVFSNTIEVDSGRLELEQCAVLAAEVHSTDLEEAVIVAGNCLFKRIQAAKSLIQMQYCTVLTSTIAEKLYATDCIFNGLIRRHHDTTSEPGEGCLRYSAILPQQADGELRFFNEQRLTAVFQNMDFGQLGCGVLHPATPQEISAGAEDGGEMGAYHHLFLAARQRAVIKKLDNFLPAGMKAVVIPDLSLHDLPGEIIDDEERD